MNPSNNGGAVLTAERQMTPVELERAHLYLAQTRTGLVGAIKNLSSDQWTFVPEPANWSVAQIVEHTVFVLERVAGPLQASLVQAPPPPPDHDCETIDAIVMSQFPKRLTKLKAPDFALPVGRFSSPAQAIPAVSSACSALAQILDETPGLRDHALEAFPLKIVTNSVHSMMDGYQWILAATAHAERHTKQILEVRGAEGFPAN